MANLGLVHSQASLAATFLCHLIVSMNTVLSSSITAARVATVQTSKRNVAVKAEVRFPSRFAVSSLVALARRVAYVASDHL